MSRQISPKSECYQAGSTEVKTNKFPHSEVTPSAAANTDKC